MKSKKSQKEQNFLREMRAKNGLHYFQAETRQRELSQMQASSRKRAKRQIAEMKETANKKPLA